MFTFCWMKLIECGEWRKKRGETKKNNKYYNSTKLLKVKEGIDDDEINLIIIWIDV